VYYLLNAQKVSGVTLGPKMLPCMCAGLGSRTSTWLHFFLRTCSPHYSEGCPRCDSTLAFCSCGRLMVGVTLRCASKLLCFMCGFMSLVDWLINSMCTWFGRLSFCTCFAILAWEVHVCIHFFRSWMWRSIFHTFFLHFFRPCVSDVHFSFIFYTFFTHSILH